VLDEARELGFTAIEQGALGWLPSDPGAQRSTLDGYGLTLVGGFVPLVLHDPGQRDATLATAETVASNMASCGGRYFVTAAVGSLADWFRPEMDDPSWAELLANLDRVDGICRRHGLTQVVHPHLDTLIETGDELARFLSESRASLCFDTGHLTVGGTDPVAVARDHLDRIGLVHLKDVDRAVAARRRSGELTLMTATQAGLFPPLGDGTVPIAEIVATLEAGGYDGWYVIETDVALTDGEPPLDGGPKLGVIQSLDHLRSVAGGRSEES
jgi:inosose dehydratase